ncbi:hypothetical protein QOZ96_003453 [Brevundimonas nasdae]|uniref:HEPN domain-containing protein n=1 Tax=Brevundimonas nasdae TaxID=172043 RepID=UPI001911C1A8|nr:HEPN domain-containing protein [Brevundimonas nasdae]MBK6026772.1 HEPN domain-containing protein [Brevundimonas nasdae]MDQ0453480.1 hypothetical protein [Brevundimonas nasdae]
MSRWTHRKTGRSDRQLASAFFRNATGFHESAEAAVQRFPEMTRYFLAIAIELSLKAYLLHRGISDDWNRVHIRHDLIKALSCARRAGLNAPPDGLVQIAALLSPYYQTRRIADMPTAVVDAVSWADASQTVRQIIDIVRDSIGEGGSSQAAANTGLSR